MVVNFDRSDAAYNSVINTRDTHEYITIFTPTYNRCKLLRRVYECLLRQSNHNFVWLVISDGSNDGTDEMMVQLLTANKMPIRYISKPNGGKHTALKMGMEKTETAYFLDCDDDDIYTSDMVDFFSNIWKNISVENRNDLGAVRALTQYQDGRIVCGYNFDMNDLGKQFDETTLEMEYVKRLHQENITCYSIEALRSVELFPLRYWLSDQHTFISESIWQGRFARKYKCRYVYKVLRVYNDESTGITRGRLTTQKALNGFINLHLILNEQYDYIIHNKRLLLRMIAIMGAYRACTNINVISQVKHFDKSFLKIMVAVTAPITYIVGMAILLSKNGIRRNTRRSIQQL